MIAIFIPKFLKQYIIKSNEILGKYANLIDIIHISNLYKISFDMIQLIFVLIFTSRFTIRLKVFWQTVIHQQFLQSSKLKSFLLAFQDCLFINFICKLVGFTFLL